MGLKFPKKRRTKDGKPVVHIPESDNQSFADDYLALFNIENIRIPDAVWSRLQMTDTVTKNLLAKGSRGNNGCAGIADNTNFIEISDSFSLALHLEQKSTAGKLSGRQKNKARSLPYRISRCPEDTIKEVQAFIKFAKVLEYLIKNKPEVFDIDI